MFSRHLPNSPSLDEVREAFEECCAAWADRYTPDKIVLVYKGSFVDVTGAVWTLPEQTPAVKFYLEPEYIQHIFVYLIDKDGKQIDIIPCMPLEPYEVQILPLSKKPMWATYTATQEDWSAFVGRIAENAPNEFLTCSLFVDPVLQKKGWTSENCVREFSFRSRLDRRSLRADYALYIYPNKGRKKIAALIEAKRNIMPPDYGLEQAKIYADHLQENVRFVFSTNGREFVEYDRLHRRQSAPKPLSEFPTPRELYNRCIREIDRKFDPNIVSEAFSELDRNSPRDAKRAIDFLCGSLTPSQRRVILQTFADAIQHANKQGAGKWGITLDKQGRFIRLNVGSIESCVLYPVMLLFAVDRDVVDELTDEEVQIWERYIDLRDVYYEQVPPGALISPCFIRRENLEHVQPLLWRALAPAIEKSAAWVRRRTEYYIYHSPGIVAYLEQELGIQLPRPIY